MIGKSILHYKILEKLGEGGMGVVYKAEDTKLERTVAIKFLPHQISANSEERERFKIEAKAAASLNHPNIAHIYAIEETDDEMFIVMEFINGIELKEKISFDPIQIDEATNIATQIVEGLDAAHKKGIVHRDIKPSNIMITYDGKVKVMDFGLAKIKGGNEITKSNSTLGTVAYMSPEQAKGEVVDNRTDIWSFGVVLYKMLTGELPFKGDYDQAIIYTIIHQKHPSPSVIQPDIPESFSKIIDRCLEKKPSERFQQAGILNDGLKLLGAESKKTKVSEENIISIAVLPFADISQEQDNKYFSDGLTEEIITKLSKLKKVKIISRTSVLNYNRTGKTMKQIASELDVRYVIEGSVRKDISNLRITTQLIDAHQDTHLWADNFTGTTHQIFDFQEEVAVRILKALRIKLSSGEKRNLKRRTTQNTEAYNYYLKGRFFWSKRTLEGFETAIKYFEKAIEIDGNYALAWSGIADSYNLIADFGTMSRKELYPKSMAAVRRALELDNGLSEAHTSLGSLLMLSDWDWQNSLKEFKLAIKLNPNYATAHHWYGEWLLYNGLFNEAIVEISTAAKLDPLSAAILMDKGMFLYYSRDYDSAIEFARKSLELDSNLTSPYRLLSLAYLEKGMYPDAIAENKRWTDHNANPVESLVALGYCYASSGRKEEALKIAESVSLYQKLNGNTERGIALIYVALGEKDLAFTWLEKGYQSRAESLFMLKIDPKLDSIRTDPRFNSLIEKVGLMK